jgi:hypothetical protein
MLISCDEHPGGAILVYEGCVVKGKLQDCPFCREMDAAARAKVAASDAIVDLKTKIASLHEDNESLLADIQVLEAAASVEGT